jgi:hypothetical protein
MRKFAVMVVLLITTLHAESRWHKWARRTIAAAACAASAVDGYTSANRIDGYTLVEANPMLRNGNGSVNVGRMVSLKIGMCAAPFLVGELGNESMKSSALVGASGSLGVFTWINAHNRVVFQQAR